MHTCAILFMYTYVYIYIYIQTLACVKTLCSCVKTACVCTHMCQSRDTHMCAGILPICHACDTHKRLTHEPNPLLCLNECFAIAALFYVTTYAATA